MNSIKMIWAVLLWAIKVPVLFLLDIFTWVFSPIICLFVRHAEESSITGFPSMFPGKPREFLIKPLYKFQSFDAPLDEWWYSNDYGQGSWIKLNYTQADYDSTWWIRYVCRIMWLCRNPAYGFGHALGYDLTDPVYLVTRDNSALWNSGKTHSSYWKVVNRHGQIGWWFKAQYVFYKKRYLEVNFGYKLDADSPDNLKVVAIQFTPFKQNIK